MCVKYQVVYKEMRFLVCTRLQPLAPSRRKTTFNFIIEGRTFTDVEMCVYFRGSCHAIHYSAVQQQHYCSYSESNETVLTSVFHHT